MVDSGKEAARYYKESSEGVRQMCTLLEEMKQESFEKGMQQGMREGQEKQAREIYERLLAMNMPEDQARAVAFG